MAGGGGFADAVEMIQDRAKNSDDNHFVNNNTALNSGPTAQATLASLKKIIPVWTIGQHKPRSSASAAIADAIWKKNQTNERCRCHPKG